MTKDLESTLRELGPEYAQMVERMRAPFAARRSWRWARAYLAAATVAIAAAAWVVYVDKGVEPSGRRGKYPRCYTVALAGDSAAIRELLSTQRADGSWASDFLTCQNAAALRGVAGAEIAYRKAVRYLKAKGLAPLTAEELESRGRLAAGLLASM